MVKFATFSYVYVITIKNKQTNNWLGSYRLGGQVGRWAGERSHGTDTGKAHPEMLLKRVAEVPSGLQARRLEVVPTAVARGGLWGASAGRWGLEAAAASRGHVACQALAGTGCKSVSACVLYQASPAVTKPVPQSPARLPGPGPVRTDRLRRRHHRGLLPLSAGA